MSEKRITKIQQVMQHLLTYGSITQLQAWSLFSYSRLGDGIFKLRKQGWNIETEDIHIKDRNNNDCVYGKYKLINPPESDAITALRNDLANKETGFKTDVEKRKANKKEKNIEPTQQYQYLFS